MVADDSATARALLIAVLVTSADVVIVGEARNGIEAIALAERLRPDLITMDVQMPLLDGIEATRQIMARAPTPIVIVTAANPHDVELSLEATTAGALLVVEKPDSPMSPRFIAQSERLLSMVRAMAAVKVVRRWDSVRVPSTPAEFPAVPPIPRTAARVIAIAASTGGPAAVKHILQRLPGDFPAPLLLVQHIADGFTSGLVHWLGSDAKLNVKIAENGETPTAGTVFVAPPNRHLTVGPAGHLVISSDPAVGGFRPSADRMFASIANAHGSRAVAVILTGMGSDGVEGLRHVQSQRGYIVAQDEATSVVWGMPQQAIRAGLANLVLALGDIPGALKKLATQEYHERL